MRWFCIFVFALIGCQHAYVDEELAGSWSVIEIKSQKNKLPISALGAETIVFSENGLYEFPGVEEWSGKWMIDGDRLRLHAPGIKDLSGHQIYEGHDSEWRVMKSEEFMMWRGTSRFKQQHLEVMLKRTDRINSTSLNGRNPNHP